MGPCIALWSPHEVKVVEWGGVWWVGGETPSLSLNFSGLCLNVSDLDVPAVFLRWAR